MKTIVVSRRFAHSIVLAILIALSVPVSAERKIIQNDSFTGTATFTQLATFADQEYAAAVFTADPADYPFRIEIETNVTGETVFSDSFERGDQSCWNQ